MDLVVFSSPFVTRSLVPATPNTCAICTAHSRCDFEEECSLVTMLCDLMKLQSRSLVFFSVVAIVI
jgi:hypothetical protein